MRHAEAEAEAEEAKIRLQKFMLGCTILRSWSPDDTFAAEARECIGSARKVQ